MTACVAAYATVVMVVAPRLLAAQTARGRAPRLGVLGWFLACGTVLLSWVTALFVVLDTAAWSGRLIAGAAAAALLGRLAWSFIDSARRARTRRAQHRDGLAIVGQIDPGLGALLVASPQPMVYCLPGRPGTVVVTTAAQAALTRQQLRAVLAHERAHLVGRHNLCMALAYGIARALPNVALFRLAAPHVTALLEMRADDVAASKHGRRVVASALGAMSPQAAPAGALSAGGSSVVLRASRLCRVETARELWTARAGSGFIIAALAAGPYVLAMLPLCPHSIW